MSIRHVRQALAAALGPEALVEHRPNHTGAGKLSFAVRLGDRRLWAKVAADADEEVSLETWAEVAGLLADRHGAPELLDVLSIDGRTALLFPYVDAPPATRATLHARHDEAAELLAGLHADRELAERLGEPTTTARCFREVWIARFEGDLAVIEGYVAKDVHAYLADQVDVLAGLVETLDDEVHSAVHGDPWHENVLLAPDRMWLLDWEDLTIGDPVLDDAILRHDALGTDPRLWPDTPADTAALRALMLDGVVDSAADWIENADPIVRRQKEATYLAELETYRAAFT